MTRSIGLGGRHAWGLLLAAVTVLSAGGLTAALATTAGATTTTPQCSTAMLDAQLKAGSPGAGQRFATVVLTNVGGQTCTVAGYGGLGLLGLPRQGVPTDLRREPSPAPTTVVLVPGGSARSLLHWTVVPAPDESQTTCEPTAATAVVTPPNQTTSMLRPWTFGPVCQHGLIEQNAYVAGSAAF